MQRAASYLRSGPRFILPRVGPWEGFPGAPAGRVASQPLLEVGRGVGPLGPPVRCNDPALVRRGPGQAGEPMQRQARGPMQGQFRGSILVLDKVRGSSAPPDESHRPATRGGSRAFGLSNSDLRGGHVRASGVTSGVWFPANPRHKPVSAGFPAGIRAQNTENSPILAGA